MTRDRSNTVAPESGTVKHNVLVFPCGSEIALEIHRSLEFSRHFALFGASSVDDHGRFVYRNYIPDMPHVGSPDFITKLNEIVARHDISFIFPAHDSVVLKLARAREAGTLECEPITSPAATCEIACSKRRTAEFFSGVLPTTRIFADDTAVSRADLPVFLKPDVGQGSRGTHLARTFDDIAYHRRKDPSLLIMEYLPGKEYTVDCFTDRHRRLLLCEGRVRGRISNGISVNSHRVADERLRQLAGTINDRLDLRGAWFFQVKENAKSELVLMEFAPRIAGTMGLTRAKGANLALLSLFDALGYDVGLFENDCDLSVDRALNSRYRHNISYSHVYVDFDDLLILDGRVNPQLIAFLYQCINNGVKLHLLTRHKGNIGESLARHRLTQIFDEIIPIQHEADEKHRHITESDAIFIDDSFSERRRVHEALGIPVFDAHMIESLIEPM